MDHNERSIVRPGDPLVDVLVEIADRLDQQCLDLRKAAECGDLCSANYRLGRVDAELTIMADRLRDEAMAIEDAAEVMRDDARASHDLPVQRVRESGLRAHDRGGRGPGRMPPGTHPRLEEGVRMTAYVMEEIPKRCPRCGSTHVVKVTRHSPDHHTWMCRGCYIDIDVPAEAVRALEGRFEDAGTLMLGKEGEE